MKLTTAFTLRLGTALLLCTLFLLPLPAQYTDGKALRPVKNVILMISDGTSLPVLSASRWMRRYQDSTAQNLHLDPYLCGTLVTYSSNAPIGDSAPTTSCYMTGVPSITGFIATYPYSQPQNDLVKLDATRAYRPMATLLEIARLETKRKVGLVMTSEFCHATPADCSAHSYDRKRYDWLVPQMVHNSIDVVIGGGSGLLTKEQVQFLQQEGYTVFRDQLEEARQDASSRTWQLYGKRSIPYNLDRDPKHFPSLAEMTESALEKLSAGERSENGFFLMVEGSKVDWAAHNNDPVALIDEFIAFDDAVGKAIDFAKHDGNTVVIVTSDHGNSGFSIGREGFPKKYDEASLEELFGFWSKIKRSAEGMAQLLNSHPYSQVQSLFEQYGGFRLEEDELAALRHCKAYKNSPLSEAEKDSREVSPTLYNSNLSRLVCEFYKRRLPVGFTTHGHTGEEVYLAIVAPEGVSRLIGVNQNYQLAAYMKSLLGIDAPLESFSNRYFAPHTELLRGRNYKLAKNEKGEIVLSVREKRGMRYEVQAFSNVVSMYKGKKLIDQAKLPLATVYVDKTDCLYLADSFLELLDRTK